MTFVILLYFKNIWEQNKVTCALRHPITKFNPTNTNQNASSTPTKTDQFCSHRYGDT